MFIASTAPSRRVQTPSIESRALELRRPHITLQRVNRRYYQRHVDAVLDQRALISHNDRPKSYDGTVEKAAQTSRLFKQKEREYAVRLGNRHIVNRIDEIKRGSGGYVNPEGRSNKLGSNIEVARPQTTHGGHNEILRRERARVIYIENANLARRLTAVKTSEEVSRKKQLKDYFATRSWLKSGGSGSQGGPDGLSLNENVGVGFGDVQLGPKGIDINSSRSLSRGSRRTPGSSQKRLKGPGGASGGITSMSPMGTKGSGAPSPLSLTYSTLFSALHLHDVHTQQQNQLANELTQMGLGHLPQCTNLPDLQQGGGSSSSSTGQQQYYQANPNTNTQNNSNDSFHPTPSNLQLNPYGPGQNLYQSRAILKDKGFVVSSPQDGIFASGMNQFLTENGQGYMPQLPPKKVPSPSDQTKAKQKPPQGQVLAPINLTTQQIDTAVDSPVKEEIKEEFMDNAENENVTTVADAPVNTVVDPVEPVPVSKPDETAEVEKTEIAEPVPVIDTVVKSEDDDPVPGPDSSDGVKVEGNQQDETVNTESAIVNNESPMVKESQTSDNVGDTAVADDSKPATVEYVKAGPPDEINKDTSADESQVAADAPVASTESAEKPMISSTEVQDSSEKNIVESEETKPNVESDPATATQEVQEDIKPVEESEVKEAAVTSNIVNESEEPESKPSVTAEGSDETKNVANDNQEVLEEKPNKADGSTKPEPESVDAAETEQKPVESEENVQPAVVTSETNDTAEPSATAVAVAESNANESSESKGPEPTTVATEPATDSVPAETAVNEDAAAPAEATAAEPPTADAPESSEQKEAENTNNVDNTEAEVAPVEAENAPVGPPEDPVPNEPSDDAANAVPDPVPSSETVPVNLNVDTNEVPAQAAETTDDTLAAAADIINDEMTEEKLLKLAAVGAVGVVDTDAVEDSPESEEPPSSATAGAEPDVDPAADFGETGEDEKKESE